MDRITYCLDRQKQEGRIQSIHRRTGIAVEGPLVRKIRTTGSGDRQARMMYFSDLEN
jgi:hypothetical protein